HVATGDEVGRRLAAETENPSPLAPPALRRQIPEVGAVCGSSARTDLCGGRSVTGVPTAIRRCWFPKRSRRAGRGSYPELGPCQPFGGTETDGHDPGTEDHPSEGRVVGIGQAARQCQPSV